MRIFKAIIVILLLSNMLYAEDKMRLAIMDLQPKKVDQDIAETVSDLLRTELFNTGLFRVIERGEMKTILKEQEFQLSGCTETECAVQMGKLLSARKILMGNISKLGSRYIINARIVDVEKGEMEFADKVSVSSEDELEGAVNEFARKLSYRIRGKKPKLESMNIKYFNDGVKLYKEGQYKEAIDQWNKISPDSDYYDKTRKNIGIAKGKTPQPKETGKTKSSKKINENIKVRAIGGMSFIYIKGGEFMMGSPDSDKGANPNEKPQHKVNIDSFWIGKYEVTLKEFSEFINTSGYKTDADKNGYSLILTGKQKKNVFIMHNEKREGVNWKCNTEGKEDYKKRLTHPVISVSWNDATAFCEWFSKKYNIKARLPYEAEWEYACRAGTTTQYYWGDKWGKKYCWGHENSGKKTQAVGEKEPNRWGLYDMSGNVAEWVMDWYKEDYYKENSYKNPKGPSKGEKKVLRGGSWWVGPSRWFRSAVRISHPTHFNYNFFGFRVVVSP